MITKQEAQKISDEESKFNETMNLIEQSIKKSALNGHYSTELVINIGHIKRAKDVLEHHGWDFACEIIGLPGRHTGRTFIHWSK